MISTLTLVRNNQMFCVAIGQVLCFFFWSEHANSVHICAQDSDTTSQRFGTCNVTSHDDKYSQEISSSVVMHVWDFKIKLLICLSVLVYTRIRVNKIFISSN